MIDKPSFIPLSLSGDNQGQPGDTRTITLVSTNGVATSANYVEVWFNGAQRPGIVRLTGWGSYDPYSDSTNQFPDAAPGSCGNPVIIQLPTSQAVTQVTITTSPTASTTQKDWYMTYGFMLVPNNPGLILTAGGQNL